MDLLYTNILYLYNERFFYGLWSETEGQYKY